MLDIKQTFKGLRFITLMKMNDIHVYTSTGTKLVLSHTMDMTCYVI